MGPNHWRISEIAGYVKLHSIRGSTVHVYGSITGGWIYSTKIFNSKNIIRHFLLAKKKMYRGIGNSAKANRHSHEWEDQNQLCEVVHEAEPLSRRESARYNRHVLSHSFDRPIIHNFVKFIIFCQAHYPSPFLAYSHAFQSGCEKSNLILDRSLKERSRTRFDR